MEATRNASRRTNGSAFGRRSSLHVAACGTVLLVGAARAQNPTVAALEARLYAHDVAVGDQLGFSVGMSGDALVAAAWRDGVGGVESGSAYVFRLVNGAWTQEQKLAASDGTHQDWFGTGVDMDGDRVLVGARGADALGPESGAAYVFERAGGLWSETAKLLPTTAATVEYLGNRVALQGDVAVVAATHADAPEQDRGAVYVFRWDGAAWNQEAELLAPDGQATDNFGTAVDVEGDRIAVGASRHDASGSNSGAAYVYVRSGGAWSLEQKVTASDGTAEDGYGASIALRYPHLAVGAPIGGFSGSFAPGWVYVLEHAGGSWTETDKLEGLGQDQGDRFGTALDFAGAHLLVGAPQSDPAGSASGSLHVFEFDGQDWVETFQAVPAGVGTHDNFGNAVAADGDGAAVGAFLEGVPGGGNDGGVVLALRVRPQIQAICSGDGTAGACPCGNAGDPGSGCANSAHPGGATLSASGEASVGADTLALTVTDAIPGQLGLYFQADDVLDDDTGAVWGDGLRCAGSNLRKLWFVRTGVHGDAPPVPSIAQAGGVSVGEVKRYQFWYRDPSGSPCGTGFNLSNGLDVAWLP